MERQAEGLTYVYPAIATGSCSLISSFSSVEENLLHGTLFDGKSALWVSSPRSRSYIVSS